MSELSQTCVTLVSGAGGKLAYRDLLAQIPPESRPRLPQALKEARSTGALDQEVAFVDGKVVHSYFIPPVPTPEETV